MLGELGVSIVGRDKLFDLLRERDLLIKREKRYVTTTQSYHRFKTYKNLIKDNPPQQSNNVLVSDITYIRTLNNFCYLSLITDLYSRKIVGYSLSKNLTVEGSLNALKMALKQVKDPSELIHHSDRGVQYCCKDYVDFLKSKSAKISMTEKDHVYENAHAERVNGILKDEFMLGETLVSYDIANKMVKESVDIYNNERLHMSIDYMTPTQKHMH